MARITYRVVWEIDIETDQGPMEAAREALEVMRDETSTATVFEVHGTDGSHNRVDLDPISGESIEPIADVKVVR